jgi:hypothetical protein
LNRAKGPAGVVSKKVGHPGSHQSWVWSLKPEGSQGVEPALVDSVDHLRPSEDQKPNSPRGKGEGDQAPGHGDHCSTDLSDLTPPPQPTFPGNGKNGWKACVWCGARVIDWVFGPVCSGCHRRVGSSPTVVELEGSEPSAFPARARRPTGDNA